MYGHVPQAYKRRICVVTLGILLVCGRLSFALSPSLDVNQYAHTAWKVREGFFKSGVTAIAQTPDGYIWLGTQFGLLRFDGVRPAPWQPPGDQHLPSSWIFSLLAARDGTLWIGTSNGLASWKEGELTQHAELGEHYIFALLEDHEGTIWASGVTATVGNLCAIRNGSVQCYGNDGGLGHGVTSLYEDSKGNLWLGVKDGLWRWKPGPPKFYPLAGELDGIQTLSEDADGALLVGWKGGIYRFAEGKTQTYPLWGIGKQFRAHRLLRDRDGALWIGTSYGGLLHVHQGRADVFTPSDGLSGEAVYALFEDREGNMWVTTSNGLDRFREFTVATFNVKRGLSNAVVQSVLADRDGSVWLGTPAGLDRWDNGQVKTYRIGRSTKNDVPESLFQDDRGRIWVSTPKEVGYLENGKLIPVSGVPGGNILSISQDTAGNLWIANESSGLFRVSPQGKVHQIPWDRMGHKDHASVLAADPSHGGLWIGFFLGGIVDFADGQIRASYTTADGLGEGRVSGFQFDRNGSLWIATKSGLSRLKNDDVATLNSKNGLPCDKVNWGMEDDDHSFWLYMACGLVHVTRAEMDTWAAAIDNNKKDTKPMIRATVFDSSDGVRSLPDSGHYSPQVAKSPDGKLWFLPWDGVSVIDPHHIPFNKLPPPVHIERIVANGREYDPSHALRLPPNLHDLAIDYTALSFVAPEKVRFRYKLEGQDRDWREVVNNREVQYSNLAPRHYTFRVMACNNSGVWNETGATLDFSIAPAYYQATWFRALCVVVFLVVLWSAYQLRRRQLQQQFSMRLEARVNERTRIARELHDTLLQSLHGLMFEFQAVRNMFARNPQRAIATLDDAIHATEQAIGESRDAIGDLRSQPASDGDLAAALTAAGKELTASYNGGNAAPVFRLIVEGDQRNLSSAVRDEVYRIGREVLRNAFHHAQAQRIEAEIRYDAHEFRLRIRDDGKGISPAVLAKGGTAGHWGLSGMRERAQQIGAQLKIWSEPGAGMEVQLNIPAASAYETSHGSSRFRLLRRARSHDRW